MSVVFLSYNGLLEPLGQSQVLAYVRGLSRRGWKMSIWSFEKGAPSERRRALGEMLRAEGIEWRPYAYHSRPAILAKLYDVAVGVLALLRARRGITLVHARSHVPALMAAVAGIFTGRPYLFDHRGLLAEEFAGAGRWRRGGPLYRLVQAFEQGFLRRAQGVIVLTDRYAAQLDPSIRAKTSIIPCAVDLERFHPARPTDPRPFELVYSGSWIGQYLADEVLAFFRAFRAQRPQARMLVLVPAGQPMPQGESGVESRSVPLDEVPSLLRQSRAGVSFIRRSEANVAASPVKVSEYLASGLPVVVSPGVGDLDELLSAARAGVFLDTGSPTARTRAVLELIQLLDDPETPRRCRALAERRYRLESAVEAYEGAYRRALTP